MHNSYNTVACIKEHEMIHTTYLVISDNDDIDNTNNNLFYTSNNY